MKKKYNNITNMCIEIEENSEIKTYKILLIDFEQKYVIIDRNSFKHLISFDDIETNEDICFLFYEDSLKLKAKKKNE